MACRAHPYAFAETFSSDGNLCSSPVRPVHCSASELVVLVFEKDVTNLRLPISDCRLEKLKKLGDPTRNLFEQLSQILKHGVFFLRARAISEKELLAQVQCLPLHSRGTKPVPYRSQELISVHLMFSRVPCVTNRSHIELIARERRPRDRSELACPCTGMRAFHAEAEAWPSRLPANAFGVVATKGWSSPLTSFLLIFSSLRLRLLV